jgi:predicted transcriptional regulator
MMLVFLWGSWQGFRREYHAKFTPSGSGIRAGVHRLPITRTPAPMRRKRPGGAARQRQSESHRVRAPGGCTRNDALRASLRIASFSGRTSPTSRCVRRRHELARRLDGFDVEKDRTRARVARQVIEQIAEVHVDALAERHHVGEADAPRSRPVEDRGDERARLRDEGDLSRQRVRVREARVQAEVRR